jgi:hypothetical protein
MNVTGAGSVPSVKSPAGPKMLRRRGDREGAAVALLVGVLRIGQREGQILAGDEIEADRPLERKGKGAVGHFVAADESGGVSWHGILRVASRHCEGGSSCL